MSDEPTRPAPAGDTPAGKAEAKPAGEPVAKQVDEAWKKQAQEEKKKAAERALEEEAREVLPPASFTSFVGSLGMQAMLALGVMENPITKKTETDLDQAQYTIDLLEVLKQKTRGNLTKEEEEALTSLLFQLKMAFVQAAK
ncbi:MAG: DUF1844 domain-containing protein [Planctomycetes bacterium]|nr:DUF1844 domain-containing protein [Planctomycetota bacterium]